MMIFTVNGDGLVARVSSCGSADKESACHVGDLGLIPGSGRSLGEGNDLPTPVLLPGKSHGQGSLMVYSPWGPTESDTAEKLHFHFHALEKEMATHSSVLAWRIPRTEEPGGLLSMGLHRVRHELSDLAEAAAAAEEPQ